MCACLLNLQVVVFDRPDLPVPYWRCYLRRLLGCPVLHIYASCPFLPGVSLDERTFDWNFTLCLKDGHCDLKSGCMYL
jgi:hypothetical protein